VRVVIARRGALEANLHFRVFAAALVVTWAGSMKNVQTANQAAGKAIKSGAYADAAKQLAVVKKAVDDSREFWIQHKKDDAIKFNTETVAKIEAAEKVLTGPSPDATAAMEAMKLVGAACRSCHEVYRVRDADNNWVLKPGSIGG
jgi:hypothetical protein